MHFKRKCRHKVNQMLLYKRGWEKGWIQLLQARGMKGKNDHLLPTSHAQAEVQRSDWCHWWYTLSRQGKCVAQAWPAVLQPRWPWKGIQTVATKGEATHCCHSASASCTFSLAIKKEQWESGECGSYPLALLFFLLLVICLSFHLSSAPADLSS